MVQVSVLALERITVYMYGRIEVHFNDRIVIRCGRSMNILYHHIQPGNLHVQSFGSFHSNSLVRVVYIVCKIYAVSSIMVLRKIRTTNNGMIRFPSGRAPNIS